MNEIKAQVRRYIEEKYRIEIDVNEMVPENLDSLINVEAFVKRKLLQGATQ